jgi:hypothetical protein
MDAIEVSQCQDLAAILEVDAKARQFAAGLVN